MVVSNLLVKFYRTYQTQLLKIATQKKVLVFDKKCPKSGTDRPFLSFFSTKIYSRFQKNWKKKAFSGTVHGFSMRARRFIAAHEVIFDKKCPKSGRYRPFPCFVILLRHRNSGLQSGWMAERSKAPV